MTHPKLNTPRPSLLELVARMNTRDGIAPRSSGKKATKRRKEPTSNQMREKMTWVNGYEVEGYFRKRRGA